MRIAARTPVEVAGVIECRNALAFALRITERMTATSLFNKHREFNALHATRGANETAIDDFVGDANCFEYLCAFIRLQRRDAHFRHHFEHALGDTLLIAINERFLAFGVARYQAFLARLPQRLEGEVRVYCVCAVAR